MIDHPHRRCVELSIPEAIPETALRANKHMGKAAGGGPCRLRIETGGDGPDASARKNPGGVDVGKPGGITSRGARTGEVYVVLLLCTNAAG
jgi:hypothetical protein